VGVYPKQKSTLDAEYRAALAEIRAGAAREDGADLGRFVAQRVLAWRENDSAARRGSYEPKSLAGLWRPTPDKFAPALLPAWGDVTSFAMRPGTQRRPPGPPALTSAAYTAAYQEVKLLGGKDSTARTPDQTEIAQFWADDAGTATPPGHWNVIAQTVALQRGQSLAENARMFALLNMALADAGILCWVVKFTVEFWRPVTAIGWQGDTGNPTTTADPAWRSLLTTPPFPAYTSGHSTFSGAAAAVLAKFHGTDRISFTSTSDGLPGVTRSFASFSAAAEEAGQSRIYGGIHWQFDNVDGLACGRHLGQYVCEKYLRPCNRPN
jgi:membrane-associated phospholipid phosphatase